MIYQELAFEIIGAAMEVHRALGCGFTEYVYQDALAIELQERGIPFEKEKHLTISYKGIVLPHDYYADFICYDKILIEVKAAKELANEHRAQILHYLKATDLQLGILINFGESSLKYERFVNTDRNNRCKSNAAG